MDNKRIAAGYRKMMEDDMVMREIGKTFGLSAEAFKRAVKFAADRLDMEPDVFPDAVLLHAVSAVREV